MVAVSGRGWRLAPSLVRLMEETDRLFPGRSTASDGSIGDAAHSARTSDHNPDGGWVDAVDITDDDAHGCDVAVLVRHLVASKDDRVKYLIHQGTIWKGYPNRGLAPFTPQVYTGPNAHRLHAHISITDEGRTSRASWWPQSKPIPPKPPIVQQEDDMPIIILCDGKPPRLLDAPIFVPLDPESQLDLVKNGVKQAEVTPEVHDKIRAQIIRALDETAAG